MRKNPKLPMSSSVSEKSSVKLGKGKGKDSMYAPKKPKGKC